MLDLLVRFQRGAESGGGTGRRGQLGGELLSSGSVAQVVHGDGRSVAGQRHRDGPPDPPAAAGHYCGTPGERCVTPRAPAIDHLAPLRPETYLAAAAVRCRSARLSTLPALVRGIAPTNTIRFGFLNEASRARQSSMSSPAATSAPGRTTTAASTDSPQSGSGAAETAPPSPAARVAITPSASTD